MENMEMSDHIKSIINSRDIGEAIIFSTFVLLPVIHPQLRIIASAYAGYTAYKFYRSVK